MTETDFANSTETRSSDLSKLNKIEGVAPSQQENSTESNSLRSNRFAMRSGKGITGLKVIVNTELLARQKKITDLNESIRRRTRS